MTVNRSPIARLGARLRGWLPWIVVVLLVGLRVQSLERGADRDHSSAPAGSGSATEPAPVTPRGLAGLTAPATATIRMVEATLPIRLPETLAPTAEDMGPTPADTPDPLEKFCGGIAAKLASVSFDDCAQAGFVANGGVSVGGRPLLVRDVAARSPAGSLGRVLLIGGIHGDELSSVSIVFRWNRLLDSQGTGPFDWRIVPTLNPDGLLATAASRLNANGVDLNRNFPTPDWRQATHDYWVRRTSRNPRRYPGESALSEPESRWLDRQIEAFRPDVVVSVHAPHGVLDFDGPPRAPDRLGSLALQPIGTYPGSLGRYAGIQTGLRVVTIELASAGVMPSAAEQKRIWDDLVLWLEGRFLEDTGREETFLAAPRTGAAGS